MPFWSHHVTFHLLLLFFTSFSFYAREFKTTGFVNVVNIYGAVVFRPLDLGLSRMWTNLFLQNDYLSINSAQRDIYEHLCQISVFIKANWGLFRVGYGLDASRPIYPGRWKGVIRLLIMAYGRRPDAVSLCGQTLIPDSSTHTELKPWINAASNVLS